MYFDVKGSALLFDTLWSCRGEPVLWWDAAPPPSLGPTWFTASVCGVAVFVVASRAILGVKFEAGSKWKSFSWSKAYWGLACVGREGGGGTGRGISEWNSAATENGKCGKKTGLRVREGCDKRSRRRERDKKSAGGGR